MNKGRTPIKGTEIVPVDVNHEVISADMQAMTDVSIGQQMVINSAETFQLAGRIQAAHFMETVSSRLIAETYIKIKESKTYKGMPYKTSDGKVETVSTLEEFCDAYMPRSRRRCEQIAENYQLLGPALYEQAETLGFRQKDYNALKALPANDQAIVKQAIEIGKFESAIDLMQEMAVKNHAEKTELEKQVSAAKADYEAQSTVSKNKQARIEQLERENALIAHMPPDEYGEKLRGEVFKLAGMAEVSVLALRPALNALVEHREQHPGIDQPMLEGLLANIEAALIGLRNEYGLKDTPSADTRPEWVQLMESGQLDTAPSVAPVESLN